MTFHVIECTLGENMDRELSTHKTKRDAIIFLRNYRESHGINYPSDKYLEIVNKKQRDGKTHYIYVFDIRN